MFLGQRLTGRGNPERDNSMPSKRGLAPRDPRDMVKAELPEPQFPSGASTTPTGTPGVTHCAGTSCRPRNFRCVRRQAMSLFKGVDGAPKSRYHVLCQRNAGSPTGRESYGDGAPVVVGARESLAHGEGAALEGGPEPIPRSEE